MARVHLLIIYIADYIILIMQVYYYYNERYYTNGMFGLKKYKERRGEEREGGGIREEK